MCGSSKTMLIRQNENPYKKCDSAIFYLPVETVSSLENVDNPKVD